MTDINKTFEKVKRELADLEKLRSNAYQEISDRYYEDSKKLREKRDDLMQKCWKEEDFSDLTIESTINDRGEISYFVAAFSERRQVDLIDYLAEKYDPFSSVGDKIFKVVIRNYDIFFTSSDIIEAQKRHGFKLNNNAVEKELLRIKRKIENLQSAYPDLDFLELYQQITKK